MAAARALTRPRPPVSPARPLCRACSSRLAARPEVTPRTLALVTSLSDELELHEDDALELLFAAADEERLGDVEPAWLTAVERGAGGLPLMSHEARAKRLWLRGRHLALQALEDVLLARVAAMSGGGAGGDETRSLLMRLTDEYVVRARVRGGAHRAESVRALGASCARAARAQGPASPQR